MRKDNTLLLLSGAGLGGGLMYLLDPTRGARRRGLVRDQVAHAANKTADALGATSRDLGHRLTGLVAESKRFVAREPVTDEVLVARVRSQLGRIVLHPRSIEVTAENGRATLSGPILAHEVNGLLSAVASVRGIREVVNQLEIHKEAGDVPGLQGGAPRPGQRFGLLQQSWSPTTRLAVSAAGAGLTMYAVARGGTTAIPTGVVGLGLMTRGLTDIPFNRLVGVCAGRRAVDIQKTINIDAPVEEVYQFWTNYDNFPRFMTNVKEVRASGNGRSHWIVQGPAGMPMEWDAVITEEIPNQVLAWKSIPGSVVQSAGIVRFDPNPDGTTRVNIRMSYNPPAGALGHSMAMLLGADPKRQIDEDLLRMKTLIETGNPPHDAGG